jgi:hypothetical protein
MVVLSIKLRGSVMKKIEIEKDYWFPSKCINNRGRKRSIAKIFDINYKDDLDKYNNGHIFWHSTTTQPRMVFTI